jgi:uncharacterized protein YozE (UPF0346 family)
MKSLIVLALCLFHAPLFAQQKNIHNNDFFKDKISERANQFFPDGIYPKNENEFDLITAINDSSKQYYTVTEVLFKKHLVELKGSDFKLHISPIMDFSGGRDFADTSNRTLFRNTRGVFVEGDLGKNFSFSTEFHENQARFAQYQSQFYTQHGELYPTSTGYNQQNAVIPGEARTKPFKTDGFDYAYAIGYLSYRPIKSVQILAGNTSNFVGDGFRSLLLSDQNGFAPFMRVSWQMNSKFKFTYLRSRHLNLMRRPFTSSAESYYEPKGFGMNYLTYQPIKGVGISLFEGNHWSRGDSIATSYTPALSYNPIPFSSSLIQNDRSKLHSVWGLNVSIQLFQNHLLYGQLLSDDLLVDDLAFQLGLRMYNLFGVDQWMVQFEYNHVPNHFYTNPENERLSYSHYNMPLAHILGNGFSEVLFRTTYEWKRCYGEFILHYSDRKAQSSTPLLPFANHQVSGSSSVFLGSLEFGYRFNRKMNLCAFVQTSYRTDSRIQQISTICSAGLRTSIRNKAAIF